MFKKAIGILMLLLGITCMGIGSVALKDLSSKRNSFEGQIENEFEVNNSNNHDQEIAGIVFIISGIFLVIIGIILISSKSLKQKLREIETIKRIHNLDSKSNSFQNKIYDSSDVINQIEKLGKLKEQGLLTEAEFLEQKRRILI